MPESITASTVTANTVKSNTVTTNKLDASEVTVGAASIKGNTLTADKIILGGWVIFAKGEKLFATTPAGQEVQFEMIDYKVILGEQPTTPSDYTPPTLDSTTQGYNTSAPANVSSTA